MANVIIGVAVEDIPIGAVVKMSTDLATGASYLRVHRFEREEIPEHVKLAKEATDAGLTVAQLMPLKHKGYYAVQLWTPTGLWAEGSGESAERIRKMIDNWKECRD